jgi:hypothetical protein
MRWEHLAGWQKTRMFVAPVSELAVLRRALDRDEVIDAIRASCARVAFEHGAIIHLPFPFRGETPLENIGIDSLLIAQVVMDLEERFQLELPFAELWRAHTIGEFVELVCRAGI